MSNTRYCKFCECDHELTSQFWYRLESYPNCKVAKKAGTSREKKAAYNAQYRISNRADLVEKQAQYHQENRVKRNARTQEWHRNNQQKMREYYAAKRATDIQYRIGSALRIRLNKAVKGQIKRGSAISNLGCSLTELRIHLESKFQEGMNWETYGQRGWHIDHIRPLASFDLTDADQLKQAMHYSNLQPLWAVDNLIKSDKWVA